MIGGTTIENNKEVWKENLILKSRYCKTWLSRINNLCCKQVMLVTIFKSNVTWTTYQVFHQLNCKSSYIIHLNCQMEYFEKSGTMFNIKLNNHTKDLPRKDSMFLITRGSATENLSWKFDWEISLYVTFIILNISFVYVQRIFWLAKAVSCDIFFRFFAFYCRASS